MSEKKKINVAIIMGGVSSEHEISMKTGLNIMKALDKTKYQMKPILINKQGKWLIPPGYVRELEDASNYDEEVSAKCKDVVAVNANFALDSAHSEVDVVFIALHGKYGEDGTLQGMFEIAGIPYTGSGVLASALAMDKVRSMELFAFHGLKVANYMAFTRKEYDFRKDEIFIDVIDKIGFPCIVKPVDGGSSVGIYPIRTHEEFQPLIEKSFLVSEHLIVQEYITGDELTCGVLDVDGHPKALPPTQIIPKSSEFFDYAAKYNKGASEEVTPPPGMAQELIDEIQKTALDAHRILGCSGLSRTDMIVRNGEIFVLETNTLPGMTETSLFPQAASVVGIAFAELLDKLLSHALEKAGVSDLSLRE